MSNRAARKATVAASGEQPVEPTKEDADHLRAGLPWPPYPTIQLLSVNFSAKVNGPGGSVGSGWVAGQQADELAYLPTLAVVVIRKGRTQTVHSVTLATRMVADPPLLPMPELPPAPPAEDS